jgi:DNA-binding HxlR family transcriptional regulator
MERRGMPYAVSHELSAKGQDLRFAVKVLDIWLADAPQGAIKLGTDASKGAVKGLAGGWDSAILRALSAQPRSLTELDEMIDAVSYPALERRLSSMRVTGQVEPGLGQGGQGTLYNVTDWVRRGVAPLAAAGRWERRHLSKQTAPVTWVEVETAFLLALPLVKLPKRAKGECVLAVDTKDPEQRIAGVHIVVEGGRIASCSSQLKEHPPAYALAPAEAWLEAVIDSKIDRLHMCGEDRIVQQLVGGIHDALF